MILIRGHIITIFKGITDGVIDKNCFLGFGLMGKKNMNIKMEGNGLINLTSIFFKCVDKL